MRTTFFLKENIFFFGYYFWISRSAPYAYWFQKTTGERLYSEKDFQDAIRLLTKRAPDRLVAEGGHSVFAKFVDRIRELLARIGGR